MRYFLIGLFLVVVLVVGMAGFRGHISRQPPLEILPDMAIQPKLRPQTVSPFFADQMSSRLPVAGTIARDTPYEDSAINTGKVPGTTNWVELVPLPVTAELMARGQQRYQINCLPCHSPIGDGNGIVTKYGLLKAGNFHDPRLVAMTDGEIFNTITYGKNNMQPYGAQVSITDRWAVIAYVRALQRSRLAALADVPEQIQPTLKK
jgi:mono/diheme cytochrome c family protein